MSKKIILPILSLILILLFSSLASAVIFDIAAAREEEWERFEAYKEDYIQYNDLEAFSQYVNEANLARNFGFYGPDYYYIPPDVLAAKYNPPLQGEVYSTGIRGQTSSLNSPSAVKYHGTVVNGRYTGFIPSQQNGVYFDHPDINGAYGYQTINYGGYGYGNYGYGGYGGYGYSGYGYGYNNYGYGNYYSGYGYGYGYANIKEPNYYARMADPLSNGFYVIGYY